MLINKNTYRNFKEYLILSHLDSNIIYCSDSAVTTNLNNTENRKTENDNIGTYIYKTKWLDIDGG